MLLAEASLEARRHTARDLGRRYLGHGLYCRQSGDDSLLAYPVDGVALQSHRDLPDLVFPTTAGIVQTVVLDFTGQRRVAIQPDLQWPERYRRIDRGATGSTRSAIRVATRLVGAG